MFDQDELQHRIKRNKFHFPSICKKHCIYFCKYVADDCVPADLWENKINYNKRLFIFAERIIAG